MNETDPHAQDEIDRWNQKQPALSGTVEDVVVRNYPPDLKEIAEAQVEPIVMCPICSSILILVPLSNILLGYPPYHCEQCDIQWWVVEEIMEEIRGKSRLQDG